MLFSYLRMIKRSVIRLHSGSLSFVQQLTNSFSNFQTTSIRRFAPFYPVLIQSTEIFGIRGLYLSYCIFMRFPYIMNLDSPQFIEVAVHDVGYNAYEMLWIPHTANLLALGEDMRCRGCVNMYELAKREIHPSRTTTTESGIKTGALCYTRSGALCLATGSINGEVALYDLEGGFSKPTWFKSTRALPINRLAFCGVVQGEIGAAESLPSERAAAEIVTGSSKGFLGVWDLRIGEEVMSYEPALNKGAPDCWAITTGNSTSTDKTNIAAAFSNGDVKLIAMQDSAVLWETNIKHGVCDIQFDRKNIAMNKLACATVGGFVDVFDLRTYNEQDGYAKLHCKVSSATNWRCQFMPQNREICVVSSGDGALQLLKYEYPLQRRVLEQGTTCEKGIPGTLNKLAIKAACGQPIVSFDWHPEKRGLCCFSSLDERLHVHLVTKTENY